MVSIILFVGCSFMTPWFVSAQDAATLAPLVGAYARMMAPFFLFYAIARGSVGSLLWHGRYDQTDDYNIDIYLSAACDWCVIHSSRI